MKSEVRVRSHELAQHTADYLMKNLGRHVTLEELSGTFGVSGTTLKKHFHDRYGMSLYAWFKTQRMEHAARDLRESQDSVLKIAGDYGYENASKFSTAFRDVMGMSPREYRRETMPHTTAME